MVLVQEPKGTSLGRKQKIYEFPTVTVTEAGKDQIVNIAPIIFYLTTRKDTEDVATAVRTAIKYGGVDRVVADLGLRDEEEYPLKVLPYHINFHGIPQILPLAVVKKRHNSEQVLREIGTIPQNLMALNGWVLGHKQKWVDDGGGGRMRSFRNFMERREQDSATFIRAWMSPHIKEGIEFNPDQWSADLEYYAAKLGKDKLVQFYDYARVQADFYVTQEGLSLHSNLKAKLSRRFLSPDSLLEFEFGGPYYPDRIDTSIPLLTSGGKGFNYSPEALSRMVDSSKSGGITHSNLVTACIFSNMTGKKRRVDFNESLHNLLAGISAGKPDDLVGFNWVKFNQY